MQNIAAHRIAREEICKDQRKTLRQLARLFLQASSLLENDFLYLAGTMLFTASFRHDQPLHSSWFRFDLTNCFESRRLILAVPLGLGVILAASEAIAGLEVRLLPTEVRR